MIIRTNQLKNFTSLYTIIIVLGKFGKNNLSLAIVIFMR
jgi:hypothetical protein